jgi:hypothetical protein
MTLGLMLTLASARPAERRIAGRQTLLGRDGVYAAKAASSPATFRAALSLSAGLFVSRSITSL